LIRSKRSVGMEKRIACNDVVPGCSFTATAATESELMKKVAEHASRDHGITDVTPELAAKVRSAIRDDVPAR
jgi:predicted small metal-binding protein